MHVIPHILKKRFEYNFLNLPQLVRKGAEERLKTVYDATGRKWQQTSTVDDGEVSVTETRVYINGIEFSGEGSSASRLASINAGSNGRIAYQYEADTGTPNGKRVEYYHTDHLGNVRLAFSDLDGDGTITVTDIYDPENEITQERHYYPFGLTHNGPWYATVDPDNAYRYNGKELDEATGLYDYGARFYDPAVARWGQVDPLADHPNQVDKSPYAYAWNNPILLNDPDGKCPECPDETYVPLANHVYRASVGDVTANGWEAIKVHQSSKTGFKGALYRGTADSGYEGEYIYATAGTETAIDWSDNIDQGAGFYTPQYKQSVGLANELVTLEEYDGVSFTGHSLGGGLASANALSTGGKAVIFNPAGLSPSNKERLGVSGLSADITAYIISGEPLNWLQRNTGLEAPANHTVFLPSVGNGLIEKHSMESVMAAFKIYMDIQKNPDIKTFNYERP